MNKNLIIGISAILLLSLVLTVTTNIFDGDGSSSGNITFTTNENFTKNLSIYRYANVSNALIGCKSYHSKSTGVFCYQESANTTNQTGEDGYCNLNYTGVYLQDPTKLWNNFGNLFDGNWSTYGNAGNSNLRTLWVNYTMPDGALNGTLLRYKSDTTEKNITINNSCINKTNGLLELKFVAKEFSNDFIQINCRGNNIWNQIEYRTGDEKFYEEAIYWLIGNLTSNLSIQIDNTKIWNYTGEFNTTDTTSNFNTTLNTFLDNGNCTNGTINGTDCIIPFIFHSDTAGILEYTNNITWTESIFSLITINTPKIEYNTTAIPYNATVTEDNPSFCTYWVTRGASTEVANSSVTCTSATGTLYVSSIGTDYVFHFFTNDTSGNSNYTNSSFSVSSGGTIVLPPSGGGGGVYSTTSSDWTMLTKSSSKKYTYTMSPGQTRSDPLIFNNLESTEVTVTMECSGDLCDHITFRDDEIKIGISQETDTESSFLLSLPLDFVPGEYLTDLTAKDSQGNPETITLEISVGGFGGVIFESIAKLGQSFDANGLTIPYVVLYLPSFLLVLALTYLAIGLKKVPLGLMYSIIIAFVTGFIPLAFF